jgi:hypothetical protein
MDERGIGIQKLLRKGDGKQTIYIDCHTNQALYEIENVSLIEQLVTFLHFFESRRIMDGNLASGTAMNNLNTVNI